MFIKVFSIFLVYFSVLSCNQTTESISTKIQGKVISVKDGDTIEILYEGKPLKVRFAHVDCPETRKSQPFGKAAKQFTSAMCFGQKVTIENNGRFDRYKRLIGIVINEKGENVNRELLRAGLAWHYKKYSEEADYADLESAAKANKIGLWSEKNPVPPWDWRK